MEQAEVQALQEVRTDLEELYRTLFKAGPDHWSNHIRKLGRALKTLEAIMPPPREEH